MRILDKHTRPSELEALLEPLLAGHDIGLLSEAGCPAVADPGQVWCDWLIKRVFEWCRCGPPPYYWHSWRRD